MRKIEVYGKVQDGKIHLPSELREWILKYYDGKEFRLTIKELRYKRSDRQNAYYWAVVIPYMVSGFVQAGNTWLNPANKEHQEMIHDVLKERFLANGEKVQLPDGSMIQTKSTTTGTDTKEFSEYIDRIRYFALDTMGLNIPDPGEIYSE